MRISEIFYSLPGEGFLAGVPSVFIRLAGCPLRCRWCDTKYAWSAEQGDPMTIDAIVETVAQHRCRHNVITGGEPMIASDLPDLTEALRTRNMHITIETAGIAHNPQITCDLMSISPKLSNSIPDDPEQAQIHNQARLDRTTLRALVAGYNVQFKFVVDSPTDLDEIEQTLCDIDPVDREKVMLMPQAVTRSELIERTPFVAEACKSRHLVFSQRLHILLWDRQRGR